MMMNHERWEVLVSSIRRRKSLFWREKSFVQREDEDFSFEVS